MLETLEDIESGVAQLPQKQLKLFRSWYEKFDSSKWDEQIQNDIIEGKLSHLANVAISEHEQGKTKKI